MSTISLPKSNKGCTVEGCSKKHYGCGLCHKHYYRKLRTGFAEKREKPLIYGVGIKDADYHVYQTINGKKIVDPFYRKWFSMLCRCYSEKYQAMYPTYIGVTVCNEWLSFMAFREWMVCQDWEGKQLDKDIIHQGNKVYDPNKCCFIPQEINKLLSNNTSTRGDYPQGVTWFKQTHKYKAEICLHGKSKSLGYYISAIEAETTYLKAKAEYVEAVALEQSDQRVKEALIKRANEMIKTINLRIS